MNTNDPRVKRTRQLLEQALFDLLREKDFHAITVQDIAERATVNRATFYAHFTDKYDLMDSILREKLHQALAASVPPDSPFTSGNLRTLCRTVFDYLAQVLGHCKPNDHRFDPLVDQAVQEVLHAFLVRWLANVSFVGAPGKASRETVATVMSWAMFGAGLRWSRGASTQTADELATHVVAQLMSGVEADVPGPLMDRQKPVAAAAR